MGRRQYIVECPTCDDIFSGSDAAGAAVSLYRHALASHDSPPSYDDCVALVFAQREFDRRVVKTGARALERTPDLFEHFASTEADVAVANVAPSREDMVRRAVQLAGDESYTCRLQMEKELGLLGPVEFWRALDMVEAGDCGGVVRNVRKAIVFACRGLRRPGPGAGAWGGMAESGRVDAEAES